MLFLHKYKELNIIIRVYLQDFYFFNGSKLKGSIIDRMII